MRSSELCLINRARAHYGLVPLPTTPTCATRRPATRTRWSSTATSPTKAPAARSTAASPAPATSTRRSRTSRSARTSAAAPAHDGSPWQIFEDWMHSPPHRANILDPSFRDAGVGVARGFPFGGAGAGGDLHGRFRRPRRSDCEAFVPTSSYNRPENRVTAKCRAGSWRVSRHGSQAPDRDRGPRPDRRPLRRLRPGPSAQHPRRAALGLPAPD